MNGTKVGRVASLKSFCLVFDENISWDSHSHILLKNKVSKNIGVLYKAKHILSTNGRKNLYYAFIHFYLNY